MKHPGIDDGPSTPKEAAYDALDAAEGPTRAHVAPDVTDILVPCAAAITYGLLAVAQELREANTLARKARR